MSKPDTRPENPNFSSGPCAKRPGWTTDVLADAFLGRSHRSTEGKARLADLIARHRRLIQLPDDYRLAIVPASDTGAMELAMWSMLGQRGVDILAWESFGAGWKNDMVNQLKLDDLRAFEADYGLLPDLGQVDCDRDIVFTWNGTTSGVRVPDGDWIADDRAGLTICDATSAVFAMRLPWNKLDVVTWSWQKVLGGEAAHGMLALSPRAVARLESFVPPRPLPKIFRLVKGGKLDEGIFTGLTMNTPSMLAVEDCLDTLKWAESIGGLDALIGRSEANFAVIEGWVAARDWVEFLAKDPATRSCTSICLSLTDTVPLDPEARAAAPKRIADLLEETGAAMDIKHYRDAPPGLRIWGGSTVETANLKALLPWLDWAYDSVVKSNESVPNA
jgi:phosphoserine aminotransferase